MNKDWKEATERADLEKVRLLLDEGADIDSRDEHGQTALMNAAHAGRIELVRLLVEKGANLDVTAKHNLSAVMLALIGNHTEVARLLIEADADVHIRSSRSFREVTALSLAKENAHEEIISILKEKRAAG